MTSETESEHPLFQNHQWRVTAAGIESRRSREGGDGGSYEIPASRLGELDEEGHPKWPIHMAPKTWVNPIAFLEAYVAALALHDGKFDTLPAKWQEATFDPLREILFHRL